MAELLLELFSEEIPARMQEQALEGFKKLVEGRLHDAGLEYKKVEGFVTPRRLTLVVDGLPAVQPDKVVETKGPRVGAPAQALEGFLRSARLKEEDLEKRQTPKGEFYFAVTKEKGKGTGDVLVSLLEDAVSNIKWPKSMRWGAHELRWVRPLSNICCVFEGKSLPITLGHVTANDESQGHRFLAADSFKVANANDYKAKLEAAYVVLDVAERKRIIQEQSAKIAAEKNLTVKEDIGLLDEVAGLVEYPVVLMGHIDDYFMRLPHEVLTTSMRSHQKYFSLLKKDGSLAPYFITVANIKTSDKGQKIIDGNERVLRARLSDAAFFWDTDKDKSLESRLPALKKVIFHAKLGSVYDKVQRITTLAKLLSVWVPHAGLLAVERAAQLAKADLTTGMVVEFTELQGVMGAYYAENDKEEPEVVNAIANHYRPQGPSDSCPTQPVSVAVALADKIDTMVGLFSIDEKPTGSRDPYALRRAALGVIRIILENNLRIPLKLLIEKSLSQYPAALFKPEEGLAATIIKKATSHDEAEFAGQKKARITNELLAFFEERLKVSLKEDNVSHDLISAVFDGGSEDDMFRVVQRVRALESFLASEDGGNLLAAYRRAANIVRIEEKKDKTSYNSKPAKDLLEQDEEKELFAALRNVAEPIERAIKEDKFEEAMGVLSQLRAPVDNFFEKVIVNAEEVDIRENRLRLLSAIRSLMDGVANFEKIEG